MQNHETKQTKKEGTTIQKFRLKKSGDIEPNPGSIYNATKKPTKTLQRKTKQVFSSQHDRLQGNLQTPSQNIHAILRQKPPKKERYGKHATKKTL